jgi:hypothetical protein
VIIELLVKTEQNTLFLFLKFVLPLPVNKVFFIVPDISAGKEVSRICPRPVETPKPRPKELGLGCRSRFIRGGTYDFLLAETPPLILSPSPLRTRPFANAIREFCKSITSQGNAAPLSLSSSEPTGLLLLILPAFRKTESRGSQRLDLPGYQVHLNQDAASEYYQAVTQPLTRQPLCHERHQLVVLRHYTPLPMQSPRFSSNCNPPFNWAA